MEERSPEEPMKICPLLEKLGVFEADPGYGANKNWIKEICRDCPLDKVGCPCVYEKAGRISKGDIEILLGGKDEDSSNKVG